MNIAICDNEPAFTNYLTNAIKNYFAQHDLIYADLAAYTDGHSLLEDYPAKKTLDILFLDIDMPGISGLEVARKLRLANSEALIIFVTSHPEFMANSFKVEAFDFLTKPVTADDVAVTIKRCTNKYLQHHGKLSVKTSIGNAVIYLHKLIYVTSDRHYVDFILNDKTTFHSLMKLSDLEEQLKDYPQFVRCHQSYLINLDYVEEIQRDTVFFTHDYQHIITTLPVSRTFRNSLREQFMRYHF